MRHLSDLRQACGGALAAGMSPQPLQLQASPVISGAATQGALQEQTDVWPTCSTEKNLFVTLSV